MVEIQTRYSYNEHTKENTIFITTKIENIKPREVEKTLQEIDDIVSKFFVDFYVKTEIWIENSYPEAWTYFSEYDNVINLMYQFTSKPISIKKITTKKLIDMGFSRW